MTQPSLHGNKQIEIRFVRDVDRDTIFITLHLISRSWHLVKEHNYENFNLWVNLNWRLNIIYVDDENKWDANIKIQIETQNIPGKFGYFEILLILIRKCED